MHITLLGAGILGAITAWELLSDGHQVTFIEPGEPGGDQAASFGNGAWLSPASVVPMSMPGSWRKVPGYLMDPTGPFMIRMGALPALAPWLMRFVRAGASVERVQATSRALSALLAGCPVRHARVASGIGSPEFIVQGGLLSLYPDRALFEQDALAWRLRRENGVLWQELSGEALREIAPALDARYTLGMYVPAGGHCVDPGGYVAAIVAACRERGAQWVAARAEGFEMRNGRLTAVRAGGRAVACERAVICAGVRSAALAREVGDTVPLTSERGYHVVLRDVDPALPVPMMPADGKMAITRTRDGLRIAGQVELAEIDAAPDWRRADILLTHACRMFPAVAALGERPAHTRWMGHRPSIADGLPVLGVSRACADVFHAFGHGHVGLAAAPASARLVADLIGGRAPSIDPKPYRAQRFART